MPSFYYPGNYFNPPGASTPAGGPPGGYFGAEWYASGPWGAEYYRGAGPLPPDLVAAVVARLRAQGVGSALGEAGAVKKIWAGEVLSTPALPWVRITELGASRTYYWGSFKYVEKGQLQVDVWASSPLAARDLAWLTAGNLGTTAGALDDPPLAFAEGSLVYFRLKTQAAADEPGSGVGAAKVYRRVLVFNYQFTGVG